jgi:hypothetical protein
MKSNLLRMKAGPPVERFHRTVETVEARVNFDIQSVANEDGTCPMCVVDLLNPGPHGGLCRAMLTPENVDQLIGALAAWKALL